MLKRYILILSIAFLAWVAFNGYFYPIITSMVFENGFSVLLYDIYSLCLYSIMGFFIGWFGKGKGWLLALIFGGVITIFFISCSLVSSFLESEIKDIGYFKAIIKLIKAHVLFSVYLVLGAGVGGIVRRKVKSGLCIDRKN